MDLFKDGTMKATTDEITTALADAKAADAINSSDARTAVATELQAVIDADSKLKAAGVVAVVDGIDEQWVAVQLPSDTDGQPKFWAGQAASIGQDLGGNKARTRKDKMRVELARISALL